MELHAPSRWKCIDCISDIHLDEGDRPTFEAWRDYLLTTPADAIFILGDLLEVWVGDDAIDPTDAFQTAWIAALRQASARCDLYIMCGNRDFLMGPALMQACGATALDDPCVLHFGGERLVLTHGDALCLGDTDYQAFRRTVRSTAWRHDFLSKPLGERQAIARAIRHQSELRKQATTAYADVDDRAAADLLESAQACLLVHGHTHHPGEHAPAPGKRRLVLSDWCLGAIPPRADLIRMHAPETGGLEIQRLRPDKL